MKLVEITDRALWDAYVSEHAWGHPLQLWGWGESKRGNGWEPVRLALQDGDGWAGVVQVLLWRLPRMAITLAYAPRGPVAKPGSYEAEAILGLLPAWAKTRQALYVRVEPAWPGTVLGVSGWRPAKHQIQMAQTFTIDLAVSEDDILAAMSRKHRQYIRKSERGGVTVTRLPVGELGTVFELYQATAARAGFGLHSQEYYQKLSQELGDAGYVYQAEFEGKAVAFLWLAAAGSTAYELYGGVNSEGQEAKANYLLKWRAISDMKAAGYTLYDFNGRVTEGVSQFKEGFGPTETDWTGTWDYPINPAGYLAWERLWPVAKAVGRRLARARRV